jgi:hypothetical protein
VGDLVIASVSAWVSATASAATAIGVLLAYVAIRSARRSSLADHYFELMNHLQSGAMMDARRLLLDHWDATATPVSLKGDAPELLVAAGVVASSFSTAGRVVALGYVPPGPFLDEYAGLIVRMDAILGGYLEERRAERKDPAHHASFSRLALWAGWWCEWTTLPWWRRALTVRRPWRRLRLLR